MRSEQEQTACEEGERPRSPQPGTENYELYRTLASSPEVEEDKVIIPEKEAEEEVVTNIKPEIMIPEPEVQTVKVPAKRGRKKKETPVPQPEVVNVVPEPEPVTVPQKPPPAKRGRKPKAAAIAAAVNVKSDPEPEVVTTPKTTPKKQKLELESSPRRSTRAAPATPSTNSSQAQAQKTPTKLAMMDEDEPKAGTLPSPVAAQSPSPSPPKAVAPPAVRSYGGGRKRKGTMPVKSVAEEIITEIPDQSKEPTKTNAVKSDTKTMEVDKSVVPAVDMDVDKEDMPLVKLVISKKKGSIFKARALASNEGE